MSASRFSGPLEGGCFEIGGRCFAAVDLPESWGSMYRRQRQDAETHSDALIACAALLCAFQDTSSALPVADRFMHWAARCGAMPIGHLQKIISAQDELAQNAEEMSWIAAAAISRLKRLARVEN